jgi:3-oxoacyl-[acyl-carrier-protein] synthase II
MTRRVAVTGLGAVSPIGTTLEETWNALLNGRSGIDRITSISAPSFPVSLAGEIKDFSPRAFKIPAKSLKVMNKTIQYALAASSRAVEHARLADAPYGARQTGLSLGVNGIQYTTEELFLASYESIGRDMRNYMDEEHRSDGVPITLNDPSLAVHPLWPLSVLANMSLCHIAIQHNAQGPNLAFSSLDAAGSQAIGEAYRAIRQGICDVFIAGGSYGLNTLDVLSLSSLGLLARRDETCRPFDRRRTGCVPGEGAAVFVIEELEAALRRGAPVYAEITGYGSFFNGAAERFDLARDLPDRQAMAACMAQALHDAALSPGEVDFINADGKGSVTGDLMEAGAYRDVFKDSCATIPVSTSKPLTGHMFSASGAFAALATVLSVSTGMIPPTINNETPDEDCGLMLPKIALKKQMRYAISNTFGFSGEHTTLVFKNYSQS